MKTLLKLVFLICGSWIFSYYGDWKFAMIFPFVLSLLMPHKHYIPEIIVAFIGVFMVWLTAALIIDGGNNSVLSTRLANIFGLPNGPTFVILTGAVGGLLGAAGAITGYFLHKSFNVSNENV